MPIDPTRGFVAIPRGLTDWEWYDDVNTARLYFHLLLTANYKEKQWQGITIRPGQLVTSQTKLAKRLGMSIRNVRTALDHLQATEYVTVKTGPKYSILTINNYTSIVGGDRQSDSLPTDCRQATDNNLTKRTKKQGNKSSSATPKTKTTTESLEQEFRTNIGRLSETGKEELAGYITRLGEELVQEIVRKCTDAGGRSWAYVRKALQEAEMQGVQSVEEYRLTHPLGAGRNQRVDRADPTGRDFLKDISLDQSMKRLKKKKEVPDVPQP